MMRDMNVPVECNHALNAATDALNNLAMDTAAESAELTEPDAFCCPITKELMTDPVMTKDGHSYERHAIEQW